MTSDLDIYRTASVLIREHGEEADLVAAERADSFLEAGDMDGSRVWKRVLASVKEIRREEPQEPGTVFKWEAANMIEEQPLTRNDANALCNKLLESLGNTISIAILVQSVLLGLILWRVW